MGLSLRLADAPPALVRLHAEWVARRMRYNAPLKLAPPSPVTLPPPLPEVVHDPRSPVQRASAAVTSLRLREGRKLTSPVGIDDILYGSAAYYLLPVGEITGPCRLAHVVWARHVVIYLGLRLTKSSLLMVAHRVGRSDHSTAWYAKRKIELALSEGDAAVKAQVDDLLCALIGKLPTPVPVPSEEAL